MSSKVVIVTGAGSGIGASLTRLLLSAGHNVVATGRHPEKLEKLRASCGAQESLTTVTSDAGDWPANQRLVEDAIRAYGRIDAAVANAGYTTPGDIRTADPTLWHSMVLTNVLGPALLARATLPHLEASSGRFVIVGSVGGVKNTPGNVYGATKWAASGLAENLRMSLTSSGIGVTLIAPGVVDTDFYPNGAPAIQLSADAVAETIIWALNQPEGVDINTIVVRPIGQAI
jgi:NADP-dependent 3-hydroxy acid dehydrogenase YdfG